MRLHGGKELGAIVTAPPDDRVVVHGHPHADDLTDGKETLVHDILDVALEFARVLCAGRVKRCTW